jgi:DNA-binding winged helix-turn-helix (wHTH) protein
MPETPAPRFSFGPFVFNCATGALHKSGVKVPLAPKAASLLRLLIEHSDGVVTKAHILDALWPNKDVLEANIAQQVRNLRKILGEAGRESRFISGEYGGGYRFVAAVHKIGSYAYTMSGNGASLEGRYRLERRAPEDLLAAQDIFAGVLSVDSENILALLGLAECSAASRAARASLKEMMESKDPWALFVKVEPRFLDLM